MQDDVIQPEVSEVLENPAIKPDDLAGLDLEEANLRQAMELADRGEDIPSELVKSEEKKDVSDRPRDELGRFTKTEAGDDIPEADRAPVEAVSEAVDAPKTAPTAEQTEYERKKQEKAAKEEERKSRSWENLNLEKERVAKERQEAEQIRQEVERRRQELASSPQQQPYSQTLMEASDDWYQDEQRARDAAKKALEIGDYDEHGRQIDEADKLAAQSRNAMTEAGKFFAKEQGEARAAAQERHKTMWWGHADQACKEQPELLNMESPLAKAVGNLIQTHGKIAYMIPDGFKHLVAFAQKEIDAKDTPSLREELAKAKAEVARLSGLTQPSGGGVTRPTGPKTFETMSEAEQMASLRQAAADYDANVVH